MNLENSIKVHKILTWNFQINNIENLKILMSKQYEIKLIKGLQENEKEKLSEVFYIIEEQNWILCYKKIFKYISTDDIKYNLFKDIYSCCKGNFKFSNKILTNIRKTFQRTHIKSFKIDEEYIIIYKATDYHINNIKKPLSWTCDKEVAIGNSKRSSKKRFKGAWVYQGWIKQSNIICIIQGIEVLARYKDIENITKIPIMD